MFSRIFILACLGIFFSPLSAQPTSSKTDSIIHFLPALSLTGLPDTTVSLSPYTEAFIDKKRTLKIGAAKALWKKGGFTALDDLAYPPKFKSGAYQYWLQFQLRNETEDTLNLVFRLPRLDSCLFYQFTESKPERILLFGNKVNIEKKYPFGLPIFNNHAIPLTLLPGERSQFIISASDNLYLTTKLNPLLESIPVYYKTIVNGNFPLVLVSGIFLGILFFVSTISFLQYLQNKDKAYFFYTLYVGLLFLTFWIIFDDGNAVFKILYRLPLDLNVISIPLQVLIYASYLAFIQYFINEKNRYPFVAKLIKTMLSVLAVYFMFTILVN